MGTTRGTIRKIEINTQCLYLSKHQTYYKRDIEVLRKGDLRFIEILCQNVISVMTSALFCPCEQKITKILDYGIPTSQIIIQVQEGHLFDRVSR